MFASAAALSRDTAVSEAAFRIDNEEEAVGSGAVLLFPSNEAPPAIVTGEGEASGSRKEEEEEDEERGAD